MKTQLITESVMRYFKYYEPDNQENVVEVIMSEDEVKESYYPLWLDWVKSKHESNVDLSFERCLDDWIAMNWAKDVTEEMEIKTKLLNEVFESDRQIVNDYLRVKQWFADMALKNRP